MLFDFYGSVYAKLPHLFHYFPLLFKKLLSFQKVTNFFLLNFDIITQFIGNAALTLFFGCILNSPF